MTPRRASNGEHRPPNVRTRHIPVLLSQVLANLQPRDGETYIDATFGAGGYTRAILDAADCNVLALDRDPEAVVGGFELTLALQPRLSLLMAPFGILKDWTSNPETAADYVGRYDGVVFDLGVSSMQLDDAARGFSFQADGPLDMRMFNSPLHPSPEDGPSAADVVNTYDEEALADILYHLGDERRSRAIARAICAARKTSEITRTGQLADIATRVLGSRKHSKGPHPATRTFQALRIFVNDELGQLIDGLVGAEAALKPGGRLVVVTFHSIEDRIAKRFIAARSGRTSRGSRHMPETENESPPASLRILHRSRATVSDGERNANPRSRSARLRAAVRTDVPAWPLEPDDLGVPRIAQ